MYPGNDLFDALQKAMAKPDYQEAMFLIERLVHNYRYWRNSPPVIEWASVIYYQTGHLSYAKNWAMTYLCASSRKVNAWEEWHDEYYLWRFAEFTSFVTKIAMICDSPLPLGLEAQAGEIQLALSNSLKSEDFMWSAVSDFDKRISQFHQQIIASFSANLQGIDLHEVFNVIEIVRTLDNLREDEVFSKHILAVPVQQASQNLTQSMQSNTLEGMLDGYSAVLRLLRDGFFTPVPERITYYEYWKKAQVIVLSKYVKSLNTQFE